MDKINKINGISYGLNSSNKNMINELIDKQLGKIQLDRIMDMVHDSP